MNLLGLVPMWLRLVILAAAITAFGAFTWRAGANSVKVDKLRQDLQDQIKVAQGEKKRADSLTLFIEKQTKVRDEDQKQLKQARADATAARDSGQRLRDQLRTLSAQQAKPTDPPELKQCIEAKAAVSTVLESCQQRYRELGEDADAVYAAGLSCQHEYEGLSVLFPPSSSTSEPTQE